MVTRMQTLDTTEPSGVLPLTALRCSGDVHYRFSRLADGTPCIHFGNGFGVDPDWVKINGTPYILSATLSPEGEDRWTVRGSLLRRSLTSIEDATPNASRVAREWLQSAASRLATTNDERFDVGAIQKWEEVSKHLGREAKEYEAYSRYLQRSASLLAGLADGSLRAESIRAEPAHYGLYRPVSAGNYPSAGDGDATARIVSDEVGVVGWIVTGHRLMYVAEPDLHWGRPGRCWICEEASRPS